MGRTPEGKFRFFIAEGEILDKPKQFNGTSIVVKTDASAEEIVYHTIQNGWEPHYVVVYDRIGKELEKLARMLNVDVVKF